MPDGVIQSKTLFKCGLNRSILCRKILPSYRFTFANTVRKNIIILFIRIRYADKMFYIFKLVCFIVTLSFIVRKPQLIRKKVRQVIFWLHF